MIFDGYWKTELKGIQRGLRFWSKIGARINHRYANHMVNRGILYSAVIIRKVFEEEKGTESERKKQKMHSLPLKVLEIKVPIKSYVHVAEEKFFVNSRVIIEDYDLKSAKNEDITLNMACNQIIHSYAWSVVHEQKGIYGVLLASDKEKEKNIFLLSIKDWIAAIDEVIEKSVI